MTIARRSSESAMPRILSLSGVIVTEKDFLISRVVFTSLWLYSRTSFEEAAAAQPVEERAVQISGVGSRTPNQRRRSKRLWMGVEPNEVGKVRKFSVKVELLWEALRLDCEENMVRHIACCRFGISTGSVSREGRHRGITEDGRERLQKDCECTRLPGS